MPCTVCHVVPDTRKITILARDPAGFDYTSSVTLIVCECDRLRCASCKRTITDTRKELQTCPRCAHPLPGFTKS